MRLSLYSMQRWAPRPWADEGQTFQISGRYSSDHLMAGTEYGGSQIWRANWLLEGAKRHSPSKVTPKQMTETRSLQFNVFASKPSPTAVDAILTDYPDPFSNDPFPGRERNYDLKLVWQLSGSHFAVQSRVAELRKQCLSPLSIWVVTH